MRDCPGGWTFCFDVKERPDSTAVLTHVRVVRSLSTEHHNSPIEEANTECFEADSIGTALDARTDALDCTEPEDVNKMHPTHRNLLRLFHQPQQQMLDPNFWTQLVGDAGQWLSIGSFQTFQKEQGEAAKAASKLDGLDDLDGAASDLKNFGFCRVQMFDDLQQLTAAMEMLQAHGLPPAAWHQESLDMKNNGKQQTYENNKLDMWR